MGGGVGGGRVCDLSYRGLSPVVGKFFGMADVELYLFYLQSTICNWVIVLLKMQDHIQHSSDFSQQVRHVKVTNMHLGLHQCGSV